VANDVSQEFIPIIEMPLDEQAKFEWDMASLESQLGLTVNSVVWSVSDGTILTLGVDGNLGNKFFTSVTADLVGCSLLLATLTTDDANQNPTILNMRINVIDPACTGLL